MLTLSLSYEGRKRRWPKIQMYKFSGKDGRSGIEGRERWREGEKREATAGRRSSPMGLSPSRVRLEGGSAGLGRAGGGGLRVGVADTSPGGAGCWGCWGCWCFWPPAALAVVKSRERTIYSYTSV